MEQEVGWRWLRRAGSQDLSKAMKGSDDLSSVKRGANNEHIAMNTA